MIAVPKPIITAVLIAAGLFGLAYVRARARGSEKATHGLTILDPSGSLLTNREGLLGLVQQALQRPSPSMTATLAVMALGDQKSRDEPILIAKYDVPQSRRSLEGKGAVAKKKKEILADLQGRLESLKLTDRSPIYLGLKRGIQVLRTNGCQADSKCFLFIRTDGEELTEKHIREAIYKDVDPGPEPKPLDNAGIDVLFCGLSEVDGTTTKPGEGPVVHDAHRVQTLERVWLSQFTRPHMVSFLPFCPRLQSRDQPHEQH